MTDFDALMTRIVTLAGAIPGMTGAGEDIPEHLSGADLPFCFVTEGQATYTYPDADMLTVSREFLLLLWVTRFDQQDKTAEEAARAACRPYLTSVPRFFAARKQLQYNDAGIDGVVTSRITRDDGPATASRDGVLFYGIAFRLTVTYNEDL